jgi:hypothetical protein
MREAWCSHWSRLPSMATRQAFQTSGVVVHEGQRAGHHVGVTVARLEHFQRTARRCRVVRFGVLGDAGLAAEPAEVGHLPGQAGAQRIERRDAQAAGMVEQPPGALGIARQCLAGQAEGQLFVRLGRQDATRRCFQAAQDAVAHLGRGLVGEGQRQHLFGLRDGGEQAQVALGEQFGLACPGRRLDDEGRQRQRPFARGLVFSQAVGQRHRLRHDGRDGQGWAGCRRSRGSSVRA